MAGNFEYYAEMGLNAGAAISELSRVSSTAETTTKNLGALHTALESVAKQKGPNAQQAEQLGRTLGLYQQLAGAVSAYGRSLKTINSTDLNNGVRKTATSLDHMKKALARVSGTEKEDFTAKKRTLDLYKQMTGATKAQADTLRAEADAIKAVAQAERTRQQSAASAAPRSGGAGGTDMWGVTADERNQRKMAQTVITAEKEMNAEFERRAQVQMAARTEMEKSAEAETKKATATNVSAAATRAATQNEEEYENGLAATRYALYEVAAAYTAVSVAALALPVGGAKVAIEMEAQFAHVARTTQAAEAPLENLRGQFQDLSTEIPVAFEELAKIGTLGAQMGIAENDLESFADTVAKFAATTSVTAEEAATGFGRLANMLHLSEDDYRNLGAAVSELGTSSVSTEAEILNIAQSIGTTANIAGFTADEVIGLSTAMASMRIRPELARGALQRVFSKINRAASEGGEALAAYSTRLGMTNEAFLDLWETEPSEVFQRLIQSLQGLNKVANDRALVDMGITNTRDIDMVSRLANGYEVYADSMTLAADAYDRGDYLEKESAVIFETTAASLEKLSAAFTAMLGSFGQGALNPIKVGSEVLISLMNTIRDMPPGLKNLASSMGLVIGAVAALRASLALTGASLLAFRMLQRHMGTESLLTMSGMLGQAGRTFPGMARYTDFATASLHRFAVATGHARGEMTGAVVGATRFSRAMSFMPMAGWVGLAATLAGTLLSVTDAFGTTGEAAERTAQEMESAMGGSKSVMEALRKDLAELASGEQKNPLAVVEDGVIRVGDASEAASELTEEYADAQKRLGTQFDETTAQIDAQRYAIGLHTQELINKGIAESAALTEADQSVLARLIERGFDVNELQQAYFENGEEGARSYLRGFQQAVGDPLADIPVLGSALFSQDVLAETKLLEAMLDPVNGFTGAIQKAINTTEIFNQLGIAPDDTEGLDDLKGDAEAAAGALSDLVDEMFSLVDAEAAVFTAMENLGTALDENGPDFNTWSEEGRANLDAFRGVIDAMVADLADQMDKGVIDAGDAAVIFGEQYEALLGQLAASGVDTAQFDYFRDYIDTLFEHPVLMDIDVDPAFQSLEAVSEYAYTVLTNIAAQSDGLRGALAGWGADVVGKTRTRYGAAVPAPTSAARRVLGAGTSGAREAQLQALEAARARAEQERLAKAAEDAAKETEKQAKEQKKAADEAKKLREEIAEAKDEGRIFEEIIKGLGEAFKDTLYQFNNFQTNRDSVESHLISMRDAAQQSAEQVRSLREEHRKLRQEASEDRVEARQAESFAAVARRYGDTERVVDYTTQAKGARDSAREKDRLAQEAIKEANALDKNRLALTGYSEEAINNRGQVRALQERMSDLIIAYAETGATTEEVAAYAENLRRKFVDQLTQMGYNRRDAERLSDVFVQLKKDIDRIPREVRIEARARVEEAEAALRNVARGRTAKVDFVPGNKNVTFTAGVTTPSLTVGKEVKSPTLEVGRVTDYGEGRLSNWARAGGGLIPGPSGGPTNRDNRLVVGPNGPEGTIRTGEFVIRKPAVDAIGLNTLHALNSMSPGAVAMSSAPAVNASRGIQLVELMPHQVHQLAQAVSTVLAVDGKVLAGTTNAQNTNAARRGVK